MQIDNSLPVVTAIIPCHNHEQWVANAIHSIVHQDYPSGNLRVMVVDDGSTDSSPNHVRDVMQSSGSLVTHPDGIGQICGTIDDIPIILMMRPEAGGPSVARNLGMRVAMDGTDIFAFLDSDDLYQPRKISASVERFLQSEKIGAVYSDYDTFRASGLCIREFKEPFSRDRLLQECIVNCNSLVLKDAVLKCGMFDEGMRVCEDYDFWMRVSEAYVINHVAESLVSIRVGEHSSSSTVPSQVWQQNWRLVMKKANERSGNATA